MGLHLVNFYSIFSASPGAYDFYRPEEFIPAERSLDLGSEDLGQVHCHLLIKRDQGFISLRGHLWCPNLCNMCAKCQDNLVYICLSVCKHQVLNLGVKIPWPSSRNLPLLSLSE